MCSIIVHETKKHLILYSEFLMNISFLNLTLRSLTIEDGPEFYALIDRNRLRLRDYFPVTTATIINLDACFKYLDNKLDQANKKEHFTFVIEDVNQQLRGLFFIKNIDWRVPKAELAYFIDKMLEGKGIMTSALGAVVDYGFNYLQINKLFLLTATDNLPSRKIAEKNRFQLEGILRSNFKLCSGELTDMAYYGLLRG